MRGWSKNERAFPLGFGQVAQALSVDANGMIFPEEPHPSPPKPPPVVNRQPSRTGTAPKVNRYSP